MGKYKKYRKLKKLTQQEVAEKVGCARQMVSLIENGESKPGITLAIKLAKLYDTTVEELENE